jgi:hypothetical protein
MPGAQIERYELITVESVTKNQYGDLLVNGKLKVSNKRHQLFDVFQTGAEVKLGWSSYMNKEYIASAEQTGTHTIPKRVVSTNVESPQKSETSSATVLHKTDDIRNRSVAVSYSKDLVVSGIIDLKEIFTYADKFLNYILNQEVKSKLVEEVKKIDGVK